MDFQDSHFFQVHLNGALKVDEQNLNPQRFKNVKVFASANFYWAADALIKNLHLNTNPDGKKFYKQHQVSSLQYLICRSFHNT